MDYKKAGVDIEAGYRSAELMKGRRHRTPCCSRNSGTDGRSRSSA